MKALNSILGSLSKIFGSAIILPAWDTFDTTFKCARVRVANLVMLTLLAAPIVIGVHVYFESPAPLVFFLGWMIVLVATIATDLIGTYIALQIGLNWLSTAGDAIRTSLKALSLPPEVISQTFEAIEKAMTDKAANGELGLKKAIIAGLATVPALLQAIPSATAITLETLADDIIGKIQTTITNKVTEIQEELKSKGTSFGKKVVQIVYFLCLFFGLFIAFPFWYNVSAALWLIAFTFLTIIAIPLNNHRLVLTKSTKLMVIIGSGLAIMYWLNPDSLYSITASNKAFWLALIGGSVAVVILGLRFVGAYHTFPMLGIALCALALAMPEQAQEIGIATRDANRVKPKYYRMVREAPKFYPINKRAEKFRPKINWQNTASEMLGPNTLLKRLAEAALKDETGDLWIQVIKIDAASGLDADDDPFYVPLRGDYVDEVPAPGTPVGWHTYTSAEDYGRIDQFEGREFIDFAKKQWGAKFSPFSWRRFSKRIESKFELPVQSPYKFGSSFYAPLGQNHHQGIDIVTTDKKKSYPVVASFDGTVEAVTAGNYGSITLKHTVPETPDTIWTHYGGLFEVDAIAATKLREHGTVKQGDRLGTIVAGTLNNLYEGNAFLHFVVMREKIKEGKSAFNMINAIDPLEPLGFLALEPVFLGSGVEVFPFLVDEDSTKNNTYHIPPNMPVCSLPVIVQEGETFQVTIIGGNIFPDNVYKSKLNVPTGFAGLAQFPGNISEFEIPIPGAQYAAMVVGVDGVQYAMSNETEEFVAEREGYVFIGFNEPIAISSARATTSEGQPLFYDGMANNTGPGFDIKVQVGG